jgi:hypothetical protein
MISKLSLFILLFCFCFSFSFGQENKTALKDKRITINAEKKSLNYVLGQLITKYDIAIGFEASTLDKDNDEYEFIVNVPYLEKEIILSGVHIPDSFPRVKEQWFTVKAENERLKDILDKIVKQMPNYKWEINDDVVNILPIQGRDKRCEKLLNIKIKSFTYQKGYPIAFIRDAILNLPEVKKFLDDNNMLSTSVRSYTDYTNRGLPNGMKFSDLTYRDLLNKITKAKRGGWMLLNPYVLPKSEKEYLNIEI